jgi:ammonia channel protein AmtB
MTFRAGWASTTRVTGPLFLGTGVYDTVGSGAVHMCGGVAAFMGAWIAGNPTTLSCRIGCRLDLAA